MKILGKNVPRWLLGTTALLAVTGYYTWVYYHVQPDSRDLMVLDEVPAKATGNLDMLVSKMQQSPERYRKFVIVTDHGRPTHAWLVGKDNADDEYAPLDPISSALENAWQTAGAIKCDLDNAPRMLAGDEKSQKCIQRFTSEDTAIAKAEKEKARLSLTDYLLQLAGMLGVAGLAGGLFYWQMQNGGGMSNERKITKAKLELIEPDDKTMRTTFADVKGMNRTVDQLRMILACLKNPGTGYRTRWHVAEGTASGWSLPAPARRCSVAPSQAKPEYPSTRSAALTSRRCWLASAHLASTTCSGKSKRRFA
ncbi:MAG: hypothetical protein U0103_16665 [Candidatus Obscuribacterales bacterium]